MRHSAVFLRPEFEYNETQELPVTQFIPKSVIYLAALLIIFQAADGILTMIGVTLYGRSMEGNFLLRSLMHHIGDGPALILAKVFCIGIIIRLTFLADDIRWVKGAMGAICCFYFLFAILPWTVILTSY